MLNEARKGGYPSYTPWFPEEKIRAGLTEGQLKVLPLGAGRERLLPIYLVIADRDAAGRETRRARDTAE